jgi:Allene oxide cyclase
MKGRLLVLGAAVAALGALAFVLTGGAGAGSKRDTTTMRVIEHATTDTTTDTGVRGDSVGDVLSFANAVYDGANRKKIGGDNGFCVRTAAGQAYECVWTTFLPRGQITVDGPFYDASDSKLAITGGTGAYASARGWMRLHARNSKGTEYDFVFNITG